VVFAVTAILLIAAVVLSACLKEVPLRLVSGNQARAEADTGEPGDVPLQRRVANGSGSAERDTELIGNWHRATNEI
jgi:hypothetical protein